MSAKIPTVINNVGKELVVQYSVKHENTLDCGGAYIKLLPEGKKFDAASFGGDTPYAIMFGPDMCGSTRRTHVILRYPPKDDNVLIKQDIPCETDNLTHLYTLVLRPDNTFEVFVDNKSVRTGKIEDAFDMLPEKESKDPDQSKPEDWVDLAEIEDPSSVKPDGYDDMPREIPDPDSKKPDDWDDDEDGTWEPPMIDNPEYMGPWSPKMIPNPDYKGEWEHPVIANPDYKPDDKLYAACGEEGCTRVGFELWQVTSGTIFDDIIITDNLEEAQKFAEETFFMKKAGEMKMHEKVKGEEAAQKEIDDEELRKNPPPAEDDDEDDDDDSHDEL
jgi:calreticulin